jgi:Ca2+-binding RTX toxin-like protein
MAIRTVGPTSTYASIAAAMLVSGPGDTIVLQSGYSGEGATVTHSGITITGDATSVEITLQLAVGIATFTAGGTAPFTLLDAPDGNGIVGNGGDNAIFVRAGVDAVDGGAGQDLLVVDYSLAVGAVTGNSTTGFSEAGGGGRSVTVTSGTIEDFTVLTGSGADTITVGDGENVIRVGAGANTVTAGNGNNIVASGADADTVTTGSGNDDINVGDGANSVSAGQGANIIVGGAGADTLSALDGGNYMDGGDGTNILPRARAPTPCCRARARTRSMPAPAMT